MAGGARPRRKRDCGGGCSFLWDCATRGDLRIHVLACRRIWFIAASDLLAALGKLRPLDALDTLKVPASLHWTLVPAGLLVGLLFGHFYWKK